MEISFVKSFFFFSHWAEAVLGGSALTFFPLGGRGDAEGFLGESTAPRKLCSDPQVLHFTLDATLSRSTRIMWSSNNLHLEQCASCRAGLAAMHVLRHELAEAHSKFDQGHEEARERILAILPAANR